MSAVDILCKQFATAAACDGVCGVPVAGEPDSTLASTFTGGGGGLAFTAVAALAANLAGSGFGASRICRLWTLLDSFGTDSSLPSAGVSFAGGVVVVSWCKPSRICSRNLFTSPSEAGTVEASDPDEVQDNRMVWL